VVTFFYILSGFFIAYGYKNKFQKLDLFTYRQFMMNRFLRLYPLHVLAFLVSLYVMYLTGFKTNWIYAIMNLFLIQTYIDIGAQVYSFSSVSWFIANCIFLYALTPFVLLFLHKTKIIDRIKRLLLCEMILLSGGFIVAYLFKGNMIAYSTGWWFIYISPYNRIFDYGVGLIGGIIFTLLTERTDKKYNFYLFSIFEIGAILLGFLCYKSSLFRIDSLRYDMFWVPVILLIIFIFAFQRGILSKLLSVRLFVKLGELSFPIFMIHQSCIILTAFLLGLGGKIYETRGENHFFAQMLLFGAIICVADVINRYYEIPLKHWIKSLLARNIHFSKSQ
jgi:peptidoglycan/LPS O-acetylase OafA/YrhL